MASKETQTHTTANEAIAQFEMQAVNFGYRFINDAHIRRVYMEKTHTYAQSLRDMLRRKEISPREAAQMANQMRNELMEWARVKSSDLGRAKARALKAKGLDLGALCDKYATKRYQIPFHQLTHAQQNAVYLDIVNSAGRANPKVSTRAARLGNAGRVLWIIAAGVAVYNIASAEDKIRATGREGANLGGGVTGGLAGGAAAGIWAGPVGVAIGAAVGGLIGAIIADQIYIEYSSADDPFVQKIIDKHTTVISTDEAGLAKALAEDCSYQMDKVFAVFKELDWAYSTDADDVAVIYLEKLRSSRPLVKRALRSHFRLKNLLTAILENGWTSGREAKAIAFLKTI